MAEIAEVDFKSDRVARVRKILFASLRRAIRNQGDDIAGFALVVWDARGECNTSYLTDSGLVSESLMPTFVGQSLNRHVALVLTERSNLGNG